ncbi:unnamed protein product [Dibothriocephalus latus]|uniref:Melanoma inhibitory activity protein 3 n=1 Tax=Dibothriocephalus latus TaxID=60516 RepID=A0A3P6U1D0_DIBLA|nr:unnamed protein product [Dibothriocephalus latus]
MRSLRPCSVAAVSILCWITLFASTDTTQDGEAIFCGNEECTQLTRTARLIKGVNFENTFLPEGTTVDILGEQALHPNLLLARHADQIFYVDSSLVHQDKFIVSTFIKTVMPKTSSQPKSPESSAEGKAAPSLAEHANSEGEASNQQLKTEDVPPSSPPPAQTEAPEKAENTMQASASTPTSTKAAQEPSPASKELQEKVKLLEKDAVVTGEKHVESVPTEPVSAGSVVANGSVSNHPEPVNHVPVENATKVGQSQSAEKTDQPSPPSEAQSSVKKTPSTKQNEPPHEGTLAGSSVEKQGAETLTSEHAPGSTVSGTPEPSPESSNLEISDQKPKEEATSAEPSEKPQSSDSEPRLSPPSPPPPTSQAPSADDSKPVEEPIATNFSEAPTGGGHEKDQVEPGPSPSSESTESKSSDRLPIENNDPASPHISEANESHSSSVSGQGNSSPHTPAPTGSSPSYEDLQNVKVLTTNEPLLDKPTNIESGHTQGATADKGSPSPQSLDSPDSPHLPEDLVEPSENSSRRLIYSGFIQCLLQSANRSLPTNLVTSKSALSSFTLFLSDNFITLAEKALTFISPNHVKMADNFLYTILGVPLSFLVAWWFFLFSAFVTYVLIRVVSRVLIGSSGVGDVKQRSLVDWLAIEEHANQLAARLADQEEANARLTIWTMELSARSRLNTHRERIDEMETAMKNLTASSQKLEEELVTRDRELAGLRDMFIQLKSFELSLSQTNADAASPGVAASRNASKEDGARPMLATSSGSSDQDAADGSDWGAEVDELANEVDIDNQLAVPERTNSQESGEHETREGQSEQLQQVLANFLDVGKLRADLSAMGDQLKAEMDRCKQETELRSQLQEKLAALEESNVTLQQKCSQAEDDRSAAQKKLEILSDYFKEREVVMQRDLGRQALSESETNDELNYLRQRAKSLDVEVKALREQVTSARHELVENERASRRQITQLDKRLHENWLAARASENLVKELRDENTALRQKIGDGEKRTLQQLISRGPPMAMPLLQPPLVPPGGAKKPDSRPSSRQFANSTPQMPLKQTAGSRSTPPFLPPPPSLPGMPPFAAGAPGVPFMPPPPPPPPPGLIPPKGGLPLLPTVQRAFSNRNSPLPPGWEAMHVPSPPPAAPHSNSGSSRSAKR